MVFERLISEYPVILLPPLAQPFVAARSASAPLLDLRIAQFLLIYIHLQVFGNEYKLIRILKHLDVEIGSSILPSQIGSSSERSLSFLSNATVNKDVLGLLPCIHLYQHKPTCWFIQTQLPGGLDVSFPYHLSLDVSYFWQSGTKMIQGKTRRLQSLLWLKPLIYSPLSVRNWEEILLQESRFSALKQEKQHLRLDLAETLQ